MIRNDNKFYSASKECINTHFSYYIMGWQPCCAGFGKNIYHAHLDNMARLNGSLETQIYTFFIILYVLYESDTTILMMMKSRRRRLRESPWGRRDTKFVFFALKNILSNQRDQNKHSEYILTIYLNSTDENWKKK